ncbi:MAG: dTDP-4-dehydrorhamnose 3,5-epimerase family protein [bacterium]|nr:dTDP-4-dehydrorhamnose 3,5-epimerase family protein [bacterium]
MIKNVIIKKLTKNLDDRGWLSEVWRSDELNGFTPEMCYVSATKPGVIRGPHEHVKQSDCFVFLGPGTFELHLWDHRDGVNRADLSVSPTAGNYLKLAVGADDPTLVIVPPGVVHGYKNISAVDALSINLPNKLYAGKDKKEEVDEIRWEKNPSSPYKIN